MTKLRILITGASRGIGLATAKKLAKKGHKLALFDIDEKELDAVTTGKDFQKLAKKATVITGKMDVTNLDDWDNAIAQVQDAFDGIDVLINNAGVLVTGKLPNTDLDKQLKLIDINCKGVLIGCHKVGTLMAKDSDNPHRKIINLSSASAIYGQAEITPYSASKFFVRGLTEGLNIEFEPQGVKVIDVMPLWAKTNLTEGEHATSMDRLGIRLTADDVGKTLYKLTVTPNKKISGVHFPVGIPAKALNSVAQVMPDSLVRSVNKIIGV